MSGQEKKGAATAGVNSVEEGREGLGRGGEGSVQAGGGGWPALPPAATEGDKESRAGAVCRCRRHGHAGACRSRRTHAGAGRGLSCPCPCPDRLGAFPCSFEGSHPMQCSVQACSRTHACTQLPDRRNLGRAVAVVVAGTRSNLAVRPVKAR